MSSKILIADDHALFREGLRSLIAKRDDLLVVGEAGDGRTAVQLAHDLKPDLVVMDISMPELNGIEATRQILQDRPSTRIIALSQHSDRRFVKEMFKAGASAYLLKHCAFEELHAAFEAVLGGRNYVSSRIADLVIEDYVQDGSVAPAATGIASLTPREREVLQLLAEGKATKEIATRLHLSGKTVDTHRRNLMGKLNIDNIADLTKYAVREGLTSLET